LSFTANKFEFFYSHFVEPTKIRFLKGVLYEKKDKYSLEREKEMSKLNQVVYNLLGDKVRLSIFLILLRQTSLILLGIS